MSEIRANVKTSWIRFLQEWMPNEQWRWLYMLAIYRISLVLFLMTIANYENLLQLPDAYGGQEFFRATAVYLAISFLLIVTTALRYPGYQTQAFMQILVDLCAITILMHISGGVLSGFGVLLISTVAGGALLTGGNIAIVTGAMAAILILSESVYSYLYIDTRPTSFSHAGLLALALLVTAVGMASLTRRVKASEALVQAKERDLVKLEDLNNHIVQQLQSGVIALDEDGIILLMNLAAQRLLGVYPVAVGENIQTYNEALAKLVNAAKDVNQSQPMLIEGNHEGLNVLVEIDSVSGQVSSGYLIFLEDARSYEKKAHALKLTSLGRLVTTVAHEISNPLAAIRSAGDLLGENDSDEDNQRLYEILRSNADRIRILVDDVLTVGRERPAEPELIDLSEFVEDLIDEIRRARYEAVDAFSLDKPAFGIKVYVDAAQFHRVIWNLCDNALKHANHPPHVKIEIGEDNQRAYCKIIDNGKGVLGKDQQHLFEPFFTTRERGTGLGLYISRELCAANGATLEFIPEHASTCFKIRFAPIPVHLVQTL